MDEKDALWVTVGKGRTELNLLNVQILRELNASKLQKGKAAYLAMFWTIHLTAHSLDGSILFVRQRIEWTGPAHVRTQQKIE